MEKIKRSSIFVICFCITFIGLSCSKEIQVQKGLNFEDFVELQLGDVTFYAQIAVTKNELAQGLMHRDSLKANHGMLFVFEAPIKASFWMKNTQIPLDIAYFDELGRFLEYYQLYPFDETPVISKSERIKYALEMNQGWFEANDINSYERLNLQAIEKFLKLKEY
ncbi:MAG: hypothetical protein CBD09_02285 [Puniceicoccaceae bacterium TMED149]|nr:MAG: hypothetical protein CBD09_02285 [Puniceicoccaceae bacterium TMED149]